MELKYLCEINGVSGDEKEVRKAIIEAAKPLCDSVKIDRMGNVIAFKKGKGDGSRHILFSAHMDEVGFIIMDATEDGLLIFRPVGGIDPRVSVSKYVTIGEKKVKGVIGAMAIHLQTADDRKRVLPFDGLYIDIGAKSKEEALGECPPGTYAYFDSVYEPVGDGFVVSKALDDRVGCYNMLRLMEETYDADVTYAFVVQEEVGCRGAAGAGYASNADTAIVLEGTTAGDRSCVDKVKRVCEAGQGVVVSFMDNASIGNPALFKEMLALAQKEQISCQVKRGSTGGNDAGAFQRSGEGKKTCVLSVPCRYIHGPSSMMKLSDMEAQFLLAQACARQAK